MNDFRYIATDMPSNLNGVAAINTEISMENGDIASTFATFSKTEANRIASYQTTEKGIRIIRVPNGCIVIKTFFF